MKDNLQSATFPESTVVELEELVRAVARLMGFWRVGSDLQEVIKGALMLEAETIL